MENSREAQLEEARISAKNYPDFVQKLKALDIKGYLFETASQIIIYRYSDETFLVKMPGNKRNLQINSAFEPDKVKQAIQNNQQGLTDFPAFLQEIAEAGIKAYDADFVEMVVSYFGTSNVYMEPIPESL